MSRIAIQNNAAYHTRLVSSISELEYVVPSLIAQEKHCATLEKELADASKKAEKYSAEVNKLGVKLAGRFGGSNDRKYTEALIEETKACQAVARVEGLLKDANRVKADLTSKSEQLRSSKQELDELYHQVFGSAAGIDFPRDHDLQLLLSQSEEGRDTIYVQVSGELRAVELLANAISLIRVSSKVVDKLVKYATKFSGAPSILERNTMLRDMFITVEEAEAAVRDARLAAPSLGPITGFPTKSMINLYNIQTAPPQFAHLIDKLKAEHTSAVRRAKSAGLVLTEANLQLKQARENLYTYRRTVFEAVVSALELPPDISTPHATRQSAEAPRFPEHSFELPPSYLEAIQTRR